MKFLDTLKALALPQQLMLAGAVIGVIAAMSFMVRGTLREPMALLYAGLEAERAGEIISELDKRGVTYTIEQEAIFVPQSERDKIRFSLAQDGLPKQAVQGYELLDEVNGFSVTSEMYNASYWRAKEGELTRTILAIPGIASARVHIGASLRSGHSRKQPQQTASVILTSVSDLSSGQAEAIQYLVALAVSGLSPDDVAVIDSKRGIIAGPKSDQRPDPSVEADSLSASLEAKIMRLIEARLGPGNAEVSVSVDVSREYQKIATVSFDPASRVIRERTTNDASQSSGAGGGELTVASNLPQEGAGGASGGTSTSKEATESVAYEINETRSEKEILPGEIQRISVAVLLKQQALGLDPAAATAEADMKKIITEFEALIRSGAGLDSERGDAITVELMPFTEVPVEELTPAPGLVATLMERHLWSGVQALLLGLVTLVLGFGVIRPIFARKAPEALTGTGAAPADGAGLSDTGAAADPLAFLQEYARDRQEDTAAMLQQWMNEDRKTAVNE